MDVGFVGIGKMGRPMAQRLLDAGHAVHAFNRSRAPLDALAEKGAHPAASARQVAERAEVVLTALPLPETVETVYAEMAEAGRAGQVFADHSTVRPALSQRCADLVGARGAAFLDAPVSGGPAGAEAGTLTVMVGGGEDIFQRALPVFQAFGSKIRLCGPTGAGAAVKLVNQLLTAVHAAAAAEAAAFGVKMGADPQVLLDLISPSFGGSRMLERNLPRMIARDFAGATPIDTLLKDLGLIGAEARNARVPLFLTAVAEQRFVEARARGIGADDIAGVVRLWEDATGVQVSGTPEGAG